MAPVAGESEAPEETESPAADLESVKGLDVEGGVKRLMGKRDFYEILVKGFATGEEAKTVETVRFQLSTWHSRPMERGYWPHSRAAPTWESGISKAPSPSRRRAAQTV